MKKIYFLIGYFLMFGFFKAGAFYEFNQEKVNQYLNYSHVQIIANSYQNLESCNNDKDKYNVEFPAYTRSECFKYNQKYSYFICERTYSCNLENINQLANTGIIDSSNNSSSNNTNINNSNNDSKTNNNTNLNNDATNGKYNLTDTEKKKLDAVLNKIKTQGESYNDLTKYNKLLDTFDAKLDTLGNKYSNNKKVTSMVEYLQDGVTALSDNINKKTSSSNGNADDFFCDLLGNCNSNQKENSLDSQKQELAKYFQDLGITQNIENNLDLLSNSNKAPNKALLDNFADKFNSVENFSKIDALIKKLNNTSNNETINFSKEYLKQKLENIKDKVKNGSKIVQGMYRLSNFKYSGDFLKTHGDVCSLEFGNEWEINKNSIDSILMTSKTTPVWNTLDKKYNCNNFTNNSLANGGANYFNSKYNNSISCSNKLNVACQKKDNNSSSSNLNNNDSQKQELAKYFQDLGVTQNIENNLDLLSNSNKAPNKALLDNFADKFNSVENFSKIDALIKKLNNNSNNETINFSKEYLKQNLENIKNKVKNGSKIVQGMYRLSNFKYSGDFLKTHGDVCSLEFGNEWEINKNSIDSILMTSKTTPVWNTLDKKYNCNNFTNNSLANGGANYFNSKYNNSISCSNKLNVACQKKDNNSSSSNLNNNDSQKQELAKYFQDLGITQNIENNLDLLSNSNKTPNKALLDNFAEKFNSVENFSKIDALIKKLNNTSNNETINFSKEYLKQNLENIKDKVKNGSKIVQGMYRLSNFKYSGDFLKTHGDVCSLEFGNEWEINKNSIDSILMTSKTTPVWNTLDKKYNCNNFTNNSLANGGAKYFNSKYNNSISCSNKLNVACQKKDNSNLNNNDSQKQELAKYFQDLGITQNIENNLDLLSNSNKAPNKALLDNFAEKFNSVENFSKIDALIKKLNNTSNNETINFSKEYLKQNLENIKDKVKNGSKIVQGMYRLSNFKYSGDFLKTHGDVCSLEFGNEWEINKNSIDSILMTSKTTPVWNTLDKKYNCNNFTNNSLANGGAKYFNSKYNNSISCSNKLNVACQKKDNSNLNNNDSQKQELAKYFQDLGITQNIENNLDLLSNSNKAPNKALLDNFADKFNSVENFSKIDALIKRLNNNSNNETINFSKEYLKQKLENIKDKVKNGSEIVQGIYRLSNFKYSGDFLKTHGDVCSLEFGNEWEINKNSIDSILMTSKTTPVWNTLDKKYNCNNFTNNSLANGGANYFNSKYNNSISCSNKLNVACQKKDNNSSSSNLNNNDSQKQELAKYFQDLGITQNIENNLDLLSNSNKTPNKALLDNFAEKFNSVENFSKIDALIKKLNNNSNNETINFSKEYLKQNLENIKNKVKNGSEIVQGMYRLSNFKYSGDFLKTHGDVCSLEFGNEWEINKNSIDSVLMTSKTTPVWNTLDKKYNCNNFTNNSLANGGANYFNSKYNNSISCSNKLNVACQKKDNSKNSTILNSDNISIKELPSNHISKKLKKITWPELSSIMYNIKNDLNKNISSQRNFGYINNYFAVSTKKYSGRDLINQRTQICPLGYKLANLENGVGKYNLEALGYYMTQNYNIYGLQYDEKTGYKKVSLWSYQNPILYSKLNSVIKNNDKYSNLGLNGFYFEYFSKYGYEKTPRVINKEFYQFYNNNEFISLNKSLHTLCQKNNIADTNKIPGDLNTINTSQYDLTGVSSHKSKGLLSAFNVIEYEYYMSYSKGITYSYYEPILDEKGNYVFYYEVNKK